MAGFSFSALSKRQQLAVAIGIPAVVAVAIGFVAYQKLGLLGPDPEVPGLLQRTSDPESWWTKIEALNEEIKKQDEIIKRKPLCERELQALQKDIEKAEGLLPRDKEKLEIVQKLYELGRITSDIGTVRVGGVHIRDAAPGPGATANELPQVVFEIDIQGSTNGIIKYIDSIERFPNRFMAVTGIAIRPGKPVPDKDALHSAKITLVTYAYQPKKGKGK